jgi:hypothetical protein
MDKMTQEPCDFVKLVLQRMDSNPDEFEHFGRWNSLCEALERHAGVNTSGLSVSGRNIMWAYDQFEIDLMLAKYREIYRNREYKSMLKSILAGPELKDSPFVTRSGPSLGMGPQYSTTIGAGSSIGISTVNCSPQIRAQMDDMIEAKLRGIPRG